MATVPFSTPWETIKSNMGKTEIIRESVTKFGNPCLLIHGTVGYYPAGSWVNHYDESWIVRVYMRDGTTGGKRFEGEGAEERARKEFARITKENEQ